ncbi:MAG: glycosyltransferase family 9 protein [Bacteroidales bacterium]|mgnify:CR=1 FL=1|nr:glycosyltransferase family 9 protein [Bacteroidales bacterium]MDD2687867.1 glycosyltransferase family 9 protein [Bacteroidales bacterium]MDD3330453.1 glycosyltransferase family 9 protein [Bacteroidales bacterium]MDD3690676.1 glycosyltransferase family 9 protein [Bacteroidales bacterium]MDD4043824.1 glycosyltransferase family 9 protein [Bacteroidales bacterium]
MKILFIRLSSIGDIVLTTPLIRCVYQQIDKVEIHYVCKESFHEILDANPYIHKLHFFDKHDKLLKAVLKNEKFDYVIDLQRNRHSKAICRYLKVDYATFPKLNIKKWIFVNFKINLMPFVHVVDRYFMALEKLAVSNDHKGLDFFFSEEVRNKIDTLELPEVFVSVAIGSKHKTKQIPKEKLLEICSKTNYPCVFLGDKSDSLTAQYIQEHLRKPSYNLCGKLSVSESAGCLQRAKVLLCGDTGLMHIAAALSKNMITVWGNTVPSFGMYPYIPENPNKFIIIENKTLFCRPCSKLGYKRCPLRHFKCMQTLSVDEVADMLNR